MFSNPSVAVVILNWNGKNFFEQFLPSVTASIYPNLQIIVADNASTDDSIDFLKKHYPQIHIIQNENNFGFAKGYNEALNHVSADYFVLLNSDVAVEQNWITPIIELMESDKNIAACQPKILSFHDKTLFEYAGASGGWIDKYAYPFCRGRIFETCEKDNGQYDDAAPIFWASGAAMFVRASAFKEVNGFDEHFFAHQEEIDMCWRLQHAGYKIYVQPKSVVYHVGGGTLPAGNKRKVYLNFRNNLIMLYKNTPANEAIWKIPARIILDFAAAFKSLLSGSLTDFGAICKAEFHFAGWLSGKKDKRFFPRKFNRFLSGKYSGNLLRAYFLEKKKIFSEIITNKK